MGSFQKQNRDSAETVAGRTWCSLARPSTSKLHLPVEPHSRVMSRTRQKTPAPPADRKSSLSLGAAKGRRPRGELGGPWTRKGFCTLGRPSPQGDPLGQTGGLGGLEGRAAASSQRERCWERPAHFVGTRPVGREAPGCCSSGFGSQVWGGTGAACTETT